MHQNMLPAEADKREEAKDSSLTSRNRISSIPGLLKILNLRLLFHSQNQAVTSISLMCIEEVIEHCF